MKFFKFLGGVLSENSNRSSKRVVALWGMALASVMVGYACYNNFDASVVLSMFISILSFVLALLGVTAWQSVKTKNKDMSLQKKSLSGGELPDDDDEAGGPVGS